MKNHLLMLWQKIKAAWKILLGRCDALLCAVLPEKAQRKQFFILSSFIIIGVGYLLAIIDMGIWCGAMSPWGIARGYRKAGRGYPFGIFLFLTLLIVIALAYYLWRRATEQADRGFTISDKNTYGSARKITQEELDSVAEILPKEAALGTILGQMDRTETKLITPRYNPNYNGNICIFGPPGSGKSFCFVKPTILQAIRDGRSVIVTDTKGEIFADTVEFARRHGYVVRRLDLKSPEYSDGWNILSELRHDDMRALLAATIIMENTSRGEHDIHAGAEESLLRAICLYVERNKAIPEEEKTLYSAKAMLQQGAAALDAIFDALKYEESDLRVAYEAYCDFKNGSPNLRGNVITNLSNRLQVLSSPPVRTMTSTKDIDLSLPGREKCIYYLCVSDQHEAMKFVASLFYSFAFLDLVDYADSREDRKLPIKVTFLMEEFANLGVIPNIDKYLSTCRSRNIDIMLVLQSMAQLQKVYGEDDANIILGDCATHLCIGYNDRTTAEYYEWRSGETSIAVKTEQHLHGEGPMMFGRRYTTGDGRRNLYTSHELMTIPPGKILIVWQRYNALLADTFGFNRHPAVTGGEVVPVNPNTVIKLSDRIAKRIFREEEAKRVQAYRDWIAQGGDPWPDYLAPKPTHNGPARGTPLPSVMSYRELEEYALKQSEEMRHTGRRTVRNDMPDIEPDAPEAAEPEAFANADEARKAPLWTEQQEEPETEVIDIPGNIDDWDYFPMESPEYEIPSDAIPHDEEEAPAPQASQEASGIVLPGEIETIPAVQKPPEKAPNAPRRAPSAIRSKASNTSSLDPSEVNGVSLGAAQSTIYATKVDRTSASMARWQEKLKEKGKQT